MYCNVIVTAMEPRFLAASSGKDSMGRSVASPQWALAFAMADLDTLRPGDWLNLREEIGNFIAGNVAATDFFMWPPPADDTSVAEVAALQLEVRRLFEWASRGALAPVGDAPGITVTATWKVVPMRGAAATVALVAEGTVRDLFLTRLVFLLNREGVRNLRACPECGRVFWRVGRKLYCSRRCTNRAVFQKWAKTTEKGRTRSKREIKAAKERRHYKRRLAKLRARRTQ